MRIPSPEEIAATQTKHGGWTKQQLRNWGIEWPPPKGWRRELRLRYFLSKGYIVKTTLDREMQCAIDRDE